MTNNTQAITISSALSGSAPTMSSREIAELTGKRHDNVVRDIEKMLKDVGEDALKFEGIYLDRYKREKTCYNLTQDLTYNLVLGYDAARRLKVVRRWMELEASADTSLLAPLAARVEELASRLDQALTSYDPSAAFITGHRPMLYFVQKAAVPSKGRGPLIRGMSRRCSTWLIRNNLGSKIRHSRDQERHLFDVEATEQWLQVEGNGMIRSHLDKVLGQNALHLPAPKKAKRKASPAPFAKTPEPVS